MIPTRPLQARIRVWTAVFIVLGAEWGVWSVVKQAGAAMFASAHFLGSVTGLLLAQAAIGAAAYSVLKWPGRFLPAALLLAGGGLLTAATVLSGLSGADWPGWLGNTLMVTGAVWLLYLSRQLGSRLSQSEEVAGERDALTGLLGRAGFSRRLSVLTRQQGAALVMIDLNDLKGVNDTAGHSAGDQHLIQVARALQAALPPGALLGRWGGDEFLAALPQASLAQAQAFAAEAARQAPKPRQAQLPFAVGAALMQPGEDPARALAVADQQMYEDKARSRLHGSVPSGVYVPTPEEFTRMLEGLETKHAILQDGLDALRLVLGFDGSSYYEQRGDMLYPTYVTGSQEIQLALLAEDFGRPLNIGMVGQALISGLTVGTADYPSEMAALPEWNSSGLKSVVVTPVRDAGQIVGALDLTSYTTWRAITPQVRRLLEAVALRLGHVLERDRVVSQRQQALEGGLLALGVALEARDFEAYGHTQRVVALCRQLARHLKLNEQQQLDLMQGAYLHDIGKLTLPDTVLLKTGALTAQERLTAQQHVQQGYALASQIQALSQQALEVILYHHERWDAQGYLAGYGGEDIPLLARVFAVCDVYDVLTHTRPYKPAWPVGRALREIEAQAGRQFDPAVVRGFLALMSREAQLDGY